MISVNYSQAVVGADGILVIDDHRGRREALTELAFFPAEPLECFINQPLYGKNGEGNGRSYTEIAFNLPLLEYEARQGPLPQTLKPPQPYKMITIYDRRPIYAGKR